MNSYLEEISTLNLIERKVHIFRYKTRLKESFEKSSIAVAQISSEKFLVTRKLFKEIEKIAGEANIMNMLMELEKECIEEYEILLNTRLVEIINYLSDRKVNVIIFPEFSIPLYCFSTLRDLSNQKNIIIICGSHKIRLVDITSKGYKKLNFCPEIECDDANKNISPVIIPNNNHIYYSEKIYPSHLERERMESCIGDTKEGNKVTIFDTQFGKFVNVVCLDFREGNQLLGKINEDYPRDFIVVVSYNPRYEEFNKIANTCVSGKNFYIIIANDAFFGGSSMSATVERSFSPKYGIERKDSTFYNLPSEECIFTIQADLIKKIPPITHKNDFKPNIIFNPVISIIYDNFKNENLNEFMKSLQHIKPEKLHIELRAKLNEDFFQWINAFNSKILKTNFKTIKAHSEELNNISTLEHFLPLIHPSDIPILSNDEWALVCLYKIKDLLKRLNSQEVSVGEIENKVQSEISKILQIKKQIRIRDEIVEKGIALSDKFIKRGFRDPLRHEIIKAWNLVQISRFGCKNRREKLNSAKKTVIDILTSEHLNYDYIVKDEIESIEHIINSEISEDLESKRSEIEDATGHLDDARKKYKENEMIIEFYEISLKLCKELINLSILQKEREDRISSLNKVIDLVKEVKDNKSNKSLLYGEALLCEGEAYKELAMITNDKEQKKCAEHSLIYAKQLFVNQLGESETVYEVGTIHRHLSVIYELQADTEEDIDKKRDLYKKWGDLSISAAKLLDKTKDYKMKGYALMNAGSSFNRLVYGEPPQKQKTLIEQGLDYSKKSIECVEDTGDYRALGYARVHACECLEKLFDLNLISPESIEFEQKLNEFKNYALEAIRYLDNTEDHLGRGIAHRIYAKSLFIYSKFTKNLKKEEKLHRMQTAIDELNKTIDETLPRVEFNRVVGESYRDLSCCQIYLYEIKKSKELLSDAIVSLSKAIMHFAKTGAIGEEKLKRIHKILIENVEILSH